MGTFLEEQGGLGVVGYEILGIFIRVLRRGIGYLGGFFRCFLVSIRRTQEERVESRLDLGIICFLIYGARSLVWALEVSYEARGTKS